MDACAVTKNLSPDNNQRGESNSLLLNRKRNHMRHLEVTTVQAWATVSSDLSQPPFRVPCTRTCM